MLGKHIGAGSLSSKNDAGPLRLQTASPKRVQIGGAPTHLAYLGLGLGDQI